MTLEISTGANLVIGAAYLASAYIIVSGLIRKGQLTANGYLSLRGSYHGVLRGAQLFEDIKVRERQALEINEDSEIELGPGELRRRRPATVGDVGP